MKTDLSVNLGGIKLKNPVVLASGTCGYGEELERFIDLDEIGGIIVKGTTLNPREGNPPPRVTETASGILNSIGLQNIGVDEFISQKVSILQKFRTVVIVNISGYSEDEYVKVTEKLNLCGKIAGLEVNISCPNVKYSSCRIFSHDPKLTYNIVKKVRKVTRYPLIVKLSPSVTDISEIAKSAEDAGADAISVVNTFSGMAIDINTRKSKLGMIEGGLSGPAIKPLAVRVVWKVYNAVKIPVLGMGGIMSADDALEFIIAGASAVAIGTANFINPGISIEIIKGIEKYLISNKIKHIKNLTGSFLANS